MDREEIVRIVEDYIAALRSGDYSSVRFSPDVYFLGPLMDSPIEGKSHVIDFLLDVSEGVKDVKVQKHIIDGFTACVLIQYETINGNALPILDYFQIDEEDISYIQPFFDPRPLIEDWE